jgi:hypothetical protein
MEVLKDGTELHLASFCLADAELRLESTDDPAFAALKVKYRSSKPTCWAGPRRACRWTAAWSSSSRRAARRCRGHGR